MIIYRPYAIDSIGFSILWYKCAGPTIAPTGTICIITVCLTTWMSQSTQSAEPCRSLYFVWITTAYSWAWGCNIHCWVFLHLLGKVDINSPTGRRSWNWKSWLSGVQLMYNTGNEGTRPWEVSLRSLSLYWTHMLEDSGMISWLALVYSTLQSSPRCSTDVGQWNGWPWYNSPFQNLINILCTVYECIVIISEHQSTNFVSPVLFNLCME